MSNFSPPEPTPPNRPTRDPDEWIAVAIAFLTIGAILFWVLGQRDGQFAFKNWPLFSSISSTTTPDRDDEVGDRDPSSQTSGDRSTQPGKEDPQIGKQRQDLDSSQQSDLSPISPISPDPEPSPPTPPSPTIDESPVAPTPAVSFNDVPKDYWAYGAIAALSDRGIIAGFPDETFQPDKPITRAEFAALIEKVFPQDPNRNPIPFKDVGSDFWAASAIDRAVQIGFMKGYPGQVFKPSQQITRLEALVALSSGLDLQPPAESDPLLEKYEDRPEIPLWATPSIAAATEAGLAVNPPDQGNLLNPQQPATRADMAAMVYQAVTLLEEEKQ